MTGPYHQVFVSRGLPAIVKIREGDSNPRFGCPNSRLSGECHKPLGLASVLLS